MNVETIDAMYNTQQIVTDGYGDNSKITTWATNWSIAYNVFIFMRTRVINIKSNWKCKHCKKKINESIQIQTSESHCPVYHIKCYMELYELALTQINFHKGTLELQIKLVEDELMENQNERIVI